MKSKSISLIMIFWRLVNNVIYIASIWSEIRDYVSTLIEKSINSIDDKTLLIITSFAEFLDDILMEAKNLEMEIKDIRVN